jgi:hypothetical protein
MGSIATTQGSIASKFGRDLVVKFEQGNLEPDLRIECCELMLVGYKSTLVTGGH